MVTKLKVCKKRISKEKELKQDENLKNVKGVKVMAVSMATIPVIKGDAAKQMLEDAKTPLLTKEFLEKCKRESEKYFIKKY